MSYSVAGVFLYYKVWISQSCFSDPDGDAFTIYAGQPSVGSLGAAPTSDCEVGQTCWRVYPPGGWDGTPYSTTFSIWATDTHGASSPSLSYTLCVNCP